MTQLSETESKIRIALMGRPNVGKSTLFNRLVGRRRALVHDTPGVTRDRIEGEAEWHLGTHKVSAHITDTGGVGDTPFRQEILQQIETAGKSSDLILLVLDGRTGLSDEDRQVLLEIKKRGVRAPVYAVVNKIDDPAHEAAEGEFFELGLPVIGISAEHNRGIETLRDQISELCTPSPVQGESKELDSKLEAAGERAPQIPRIAIVGKPNVGKSTLLNALLGEERAVTSPIPGTTTDFIEVKSDFRGRDVVWIDTAGIQRKSKTKRGVEVLSVVQTKKAVECADVVLLLLDASTGPSDQDEKIAGLIYESGAAVLLVANKWDLQEGNPKFSKAEAERRVREQFGFLRHAPLIFISAKKAKGLEHMVSSALKIHASMETRPPARELSSLLKRELEVHNPRDAKIYTCQQMSSRPPTFLCHVNHPSKFGVTIKRHLINAIRDRWGYAGVPIRLMLRKSRATK